MESACADPRANQSLLLLHSSSNDGASLGFEQQNLLSGADDHKIET